MTVYKLERSNIPLTSAVLIDDITREALKPFDLDPDVPTRFYPFILPEEARKGFGIGVIVGRSGSGKSLLLSEYGKNKLTVWDNSRSITSHFHSAKIASDRFYATGLNSVPAWKQAFNTLSNGEQFRANLARRLEDNARIDEFTSVVDRDVAVSVSTSISRYIRKIGLSNVVLATCHRDVIGWLNPDWIIDTDSCKFITRAEFGKPQWWEEFVVDGGRCGRLIAK